MLVVFKIFKFVDFKVKVGGQTGGVTFEVRVLCEKGRLVSESLRERK